MITRAYEVSGLKPYDEELGKEASFYSLLALGIEQIYGPRMERITIVSSPNITPEQLESHADWLKAAFQSNGWINVEVRELGVSVGIKGEETE